MVAPCPRNLKRRRIAIIELPRQAIVVIRGKTFYLGPWNSSESQVAYKRVIAEHWSKATVTPSAPQISASDGIKLTIKRDDPRLLEPPVLPYYYVKDGHPTSERDNIRQALRFVRSLHGNTLAREFGPLALKAVRQAMIAAGRCRTLINKDIHRIRGMFRWAVSEELYPGECLTNLDAVQALEKGRSAAKERPPIAPVRNEVVMETLPHLSSQVAAMVRLQLLTAARPGEVASIRPRDVDRTHPDSWVYRPRLTRPSITNGAGSS